MGFFSEKKYKTLVLNKMYKKRLFILFCFLHNVIDIILKTYDLLYLMNNNQVDLLIQINLLILQIRLNKH